MGYGWRMGDMASAGMLTVPTAQALRDYPVSDLPAVGPVQTLGALSVGDYGGRTWRYVSGAAPGTYTDNLGTVLVPTGGDGSAAWLVLDFRVVTPFQFGADPGSDCAAAIQAAIDSVALSATPAELVKRRPARIALVDFCDQMLPIESQLCLKSGVYLGHGGIYAGDAMAHMVKSEFYDDYLLDPDADYLSHWIGFDGRFSVEARGYAMSDGVCVGLAQDFMQADHLTIVGIDDDTSAVALDGVLGLHLIGHHADHPARNYFAESKIEHVKVSRFYQGIDIDVPDLVVDSAVVQTCMDYGIRLRKLPQINKIHAYGCDINNYTGEASPRGYGVWCNADGDVAPLHADGTNIETETNTIGICFDGSVAMTSHLNVFAYRSRQHDVLLINGATVSGDITLTSGPKSTSYPYIVGVRCEDTSHFHNCDLEFSGYHRSLQVTAKGCHFSGAIQTAYSSSDGQSATDPGYLYLQQCTGSLVLNSVSGDAAQTQINLCGYQSNLALAGRALAGGGDPELLIGKTGLDDLRTSVLSLGGNIAITIEDDGGDNRIELNTSTNTADHTVTGKDASTRIAEGNTVTRSERVDVHTDSGTGSQTLFQIWRSPLSTADDRVAVVVTPMTEDARGDFYADYVSPNVRIHYASAPPSGTDNLKWSVHVVPI